MQTSHDGILQDYNHHEGTNVGMEGRKQGREKNSLTTKTKGVS